MPDWEFEVGKVYYKVYQVPAPDVENMPRVISSWVYEGEDWREGGPRECSVSYQFAEFESWYRQKIHGEPCEVTRRWTGTLER